MTEFASVDLWDSPRDRYRSMDGLTLFVWIFVAFVVLLPGEMLLRGATMLLGVVLALSYSAANMNQNRAKRDSIRTDSRQIWRTRSAA